MQPGTYSEDLLVAGYLSAEHREQLSGGPALLASRHGPGLVVRMADNYLFRGYWRGDGAWRRMAGPATGRRA
jgi:hypothetical protein